MRATRETDVAIIIASVVVPLALTIATVVLVAIILTVYMKDRKDKFKPKPDRYDCHNFLFVCTRFSKI